MTGFAASAKEKGVWSLTILVCWSIWRERNFKKFEAQEKQAFSCSDKNQGRGQALGAGGREAPISAS
jgi:hypothetical protein